MNQFWLEWLQLSGNALHRPTIYPYEFNEEFPTNLLLDNLSLLINEYEDVARIVGDELALALQQWFVKIPMKVLLVFVNTVVDVAPQQLLVVIDEQRHQLLHL